MFRPSRIIATSFLFITFSSQIFANDSVPPYSEQLLSTIQTQASSVPGDFPVAIHYVEYATSTRTMADTIENGDPQKSYVQSRTAYQVVYPKGTVMVDAGMSEQMNQFFGNSSNLTYDSAANEQIQKALLNANKIIITHEHTDHVGGVIGTKFFNQLAPKTLLTFQQANTLKTNPQMPAVKLTNEQANQFDLIDFREYLPVAPGIVLIKAPGHTPGEIMVYIQLQNGQKYIISGDVSWSFQGIQTKTQKPLAQIKRIKENSEQIKQELDWLHTVMQKGIHVVVNHDQQLNQDLVKKGLMIEGLQ